MRFELRTKIDEATLELLAAPALISSHETQAEAWMALIARQRTGGTLIVVDTETGQTWTHNP